MRDSFPASNQIVTLDMKVILESNIAIWYEKQKVV
jgi:hypothetical protein